MDTDLGAHSLYLDQPQEHAAFDSQNEAVNFAMSLDHPQRRTVRLHLPGGDIAELAVIEQMYVQHQKNQ
jgi:hypothetical protein